MEIVNDITLNDEVLTKLRVGVNKLADAVKSTLGPRGQYVIIQRDNGLEPMVTKDGVTVANAIKLDDPVENLGAQLVRQSASKTADMAGDGTTTATILAAAIFNEGMRSVMAGASPIQIKSGIEKAVGAVIADLQSHTIKIKTHEEIQAIATIAANNDPAIGSKLAEAFAKVGADGVITVEEGGGVDTTIEWIEGMQFDRGYISPYFTNNKPKTECVLENPYILIFDRKLSNFNDLLPLLEEVSKKTRPLLIIADEIEGDALTAMIVNHTRGAFTSCGVKAPSFGEHRSNLLNDIRVMTGAALPPPGVYTISDIKLEHLGSAKRIIVTKDTCTILRGEGKEVEEHVNALREELKSKGTAKTYDKEKLQERLAKLTSGVVTLRIGALTEAELMEKKARVDDALHSVKAASESGFLPGGGTALLRAQKSIDALPTDSHGEAVGMTIVRAALEYPLRQIAMNAGQDASVVCNLVKSHALYSEGYDARNGTYTDLVEAGIIDPTKVVCSALMNAASISAILLNTRAIISFKKISA